jgi:hypothetical protein
MMASNSPPKRTNKPPKILKLTGMLFPWKQGQPVYLELSRSQYCYLPVFDEEWLLRETMEKAKAKFDKIKRIDDGPEFLTSFPPRCSKAHPYRSELPVHSGRENQMDRASMASV